MISRSRNPIQDIVQTRIGFILGYFAIAFLLLPVYYRLNLPTIYSYLKERSAAKIAVANFTQWLASEMALKYGDGIRVNAIAPGFFIGDQNRRVLINPDGSLTDRSKKVLAKTPMNRFGDIKELNGAVQFLCSEAASFVTGAMLPIDGGFSAFSGV